MLNSSFSGLYPYFTYNPINNESFSCLVWKNQPQQIQKEGMCLLVSCVCASLPVPVAVLKAFVPQDHIAAKLLRSRKENAKVLNLNLDSVLIANELFCPSIP